MKPTQITDLLANIRASFVSFFSILMFVTLGVGVFLGISWAAPALQNAADDMFAKGSFHDIQILFPYGLTESDLGKIARLDGVSEIEKGRQSFETMRVDNRKKTIKVQSLGQHIDTAMIVEGELPTKPDEIAFHAESAKQLGLHVGDTITFDEYNDKDAKADDSSKSSDEKGENADRTIFLLRCTYTVTALVNSAEYAANDTGTYGFTDTPSGAIDGIAWVVGDAFDGSAFLDGYNVANIRYDSLVGMSTFSDEYKAASSQKEEAVEDIGSTLAKVRYEELHADSEKEIADAKKEIADGEQKIKDGEEKVEQAKKDIADGEQSIADGEQNLANGYAQIASGERQLSEAQAKYDAETAAARAQLDEEKSKLDAAQQEYDGAVGLLNQMKAEYEQAVLAGAPPEELEAMRQLIESFEQELAVKKAQLDQGRQQYSAAVAQFEQETAASRQKIDEAAAQLSSARSQVAQGEADLASARQQLEDGRRELADKEKELTQAKEDLEKGKVDLADAEKALDDLSAIDWSVMPRSYNGGAGQVSMFSDVTNDLSISMAALFIIVGLLVTYFAVSRIVNEQTTQLGTKKALGFRRNEITVNYLLYSGIAVVLGAILGGVVAYLVVERIIGQTLGDMFAFGAYPAYFGWGQFLVIFAIELVMVLAATYMACRRILRKHAIELLRGSEPPQAKVRIYEKWGLWDKLPLFVQTIVNNCMNDKRRVLST